MSPTNPAIVLQANNIKRVFNDGELHVEVLRDIQLTVHKGETVAIIGSSGSGKSTLLHILGGLDKPDEGEVELNGQNYSSLSENERDIIRNKQLGFVYQFHHLLGEFTACENVAMPLLINGTPIGQAHDKAREMLQLVGLKDRSEHLPAQLSGGERQRVAIARALINQPSCVLADEPTGNLDRKTAQNVFKLLRHLAQELGIAFILVSHDMSLSAACDRVLEMQNGSLTELHTLEPMG